MRHYIKCDDDAKHDTKSLRKFKGEQKKINE